MNEKIKMNKEILNQYLKDKENLKVKKNALLLGAGGPLGGLEAGALIALDEYGVEFDIISGACIGSVLALAYSSPNTKPINGVQIAANGREALEYWCENTCVSDLIYMFFPGDYKAFQKDGGIFNTMWDNISRVLYSINPFFTIKPENNFQKLYNDLYTMLISSLAPCTTTYFSKAISRIPEGSLELLIDFEKLKTIEKDVYINSLNVTDKKITSFNKNEITPEHVVAGSSLFFVANQQYIKGKNNDDGKWYGEGSYIDSLNFEGIIETHREKDEFIDTIVVMNILKKDALIRRPKNLYDAYTLSVILPFITIALDDIKIFNLQYNTYYDEKEHEYKQIRNLLTVDFKIPDEDIPYILDWSSSNFKNLRKIGYDAGIDFLLNEKNLICLNIYENNASNELKELYKEHGKKLPVKPKNTNSENKAKAGASSSQA